MPCGVALSRTQFLGATIAGYQASIGWNGAHGELIAEVVQDDCIGGGIAYRDDGNGDSFLATEDAFDPPPLGYPVTLNFSGFSFSGILQSWKENDPATGAKTYTTRIVDPKNIVDGTQLILNNYIGQTFECPNLINVFGWLEHNLGAYCAEAGTFAWYPPFGFNMILNYLPARGFGGADNFGGLPWWQVKMALEYLLNQVGDDFGGKLQYRDHRYNVDLSDLPNLDNYVRFGNDGMSLTELIAEVCEVSSHDYFFSLVNHDTIKVNVVDRSQQANDISARDVDTAQGTNINDRLDQGTIGNSVSTAQGLTTRSRGVELREDYTNSFLTGDYRQDIWQIDFNATTNPAWANIWPYWGEDANDNVIPSYGIATADLSSEHYFDVDVSSWGIPGLSGTWRITATELRFALTGETQWRDFCLARQPNLAALLGFAVEDEFPDRDTFLFRAMQVGFIRPINFAAASRKQAELADLEAIFWGKITEIYQRIYQYATVYFGRKFLIKLPYLCIKMDDDTPYTIQTNWQTVDSGWFSGGVLGLFPGSIYLERFRQDDGRITAFVGFESVLPLDLSGISDGSYVQINPYMAYVQCRVEKIVSVFPGDWRAVIELPGTVHINNPHASLERMLGLWAMMKTKYGTVNDEKLAKVMKNAGADRNKYWLQPLPQIPLKAAIPLQSNRLTYGPWGAKIGDLSDLPTNTAGKTDYVHDTEFAPWNFGSMTRMNAAGDAYVSGKLSDHYVVEQGSIAVPDAPAFNLGEALFAGGPLITQMNTVMRGDASPVITTYTMKTYTPNYGKLAQHYVAAIKRVGQWARRGNRIFRKWSLEHNRTFKDQILAGWFLPPQIPWVVRYDPGSSLDVLAGHNITDSDDTDHSRSNVVMTELRRHLPELCAKSAEYQGKATMDLNGLLRPFSTSFNDSAWKLPTFENAGTPNAFNLNYLSTNTLFYSKEQVPPIICKEHHLPIVMETLSPFLAEGSSVNGFPMGTSKGHDIEYITRDGIYPAHLSIRHPQDNYSETHHYRAIALRGPLVIAGWGFDIDNKPVPNASPAYPDNAKMEFADNWLRRPETWKCGPVDLRWDDRRKVWTAPSPFKLVRVRLCGPLIPGYVAAGIIIDENYQLDHQGNTLSWDGNSCCSVSPNGMIAIHTLPYIGGGYPGLIALPDTIITARYNTTNGKYYAVAAHDLPLFKIRMLTNMAFSISGVVIGSGTGVLLDTIPIAGTNYCLSQKTVFIHNMLSQPITQNTTLIGKLYNITPTEYIEVQDGPNCSVQAVFDAAYTFVPLQAQFAPLTVVIHADLVECIDNQQETLDCDVEIGPYCCEYGDIEVECTMQDDWVEYELCVCYRNIYLQTAWSNMQCTTGRDDYGNRLPSWCADPCAVAMEPDHVPG